MVHVDAHILATPILADINDDGVVSELIIPVSHYYDPYQYRSVTCDTLCSALHANIQF